jgi:hypothetical protein
MSNIPDFEDSDLDPEWGEVDFDDTSKSPKFFPMPAHAVEDPEVFKTMLESKVDGLILMYREIRDQLGTDRHGWKARDELMKRRMLLISSELMRRGEALGVDSFRTDQGTAYKHTKEKFKIENWDEVREYLDETHNYHILQKRVSPDAVRGIRTEDGSLPKGVGVFEEVEFAVRTPTVRKFK